MGIEVLGVGPLFLSSCFREFILWAEDVGLVLEGVFVFDPAVMEADERDWSRIMWDVDWGLMIDVF